jgi:hypothetical protein
MPSLEELVQEFARRARLQLMQQIEEQQDADTSTAKWQGYDADGNPIVKDGDQTKVVRGIGDTGLVKGQRVILDNAGSIEYKRRRQEEQKQLDKKRKRVAQPRRLKVRDNLISVAPVIEEEAYLEEELPVFEIVTDGLYLLTYTSFQAEPRRRSDFEWANYIVDDLSAADTIVIPQYIDLPTGVDKIYQIVFGSVACNARNTVGGAGTSSASVSGMGLDLSVSVENSSSSSLIHSIDVDMFIRESDVGGDNIELIAEGSNLIDPIFGFELFGGSASAAAQCITFPFSKHIYYYQIQNDPAEPTQKRVRSFDLASVVTGDIYDSRLVHNYANKEGVDGDSVYVYSVWFVTTVDFSQELTVEDSETSDTRTIRKKVGKMTRYIVHARININTGEVESKVNESPNSGQYLLGNVVEYNDDTSYYFEIRVDADGTPNSFFRDTFAGTGSTEWWRFIPLQILFDDYTDHFNPEAIWREAFEGDWLYPYRNIAWDSAAFANITQFDFFTFLNASYKDGKFYTNWDMVRLPVAGSGGLFREYDPAGTNREGNTPVDNDFHDIESLAFLISNEPNVLYEDYFDGSQPNTPDDIADWPENTHITLRPDVLFLDSGFIVERTVGGPDFDLSENIIASGSPLGDRLNDGPRLSYIPPFTPPP